MKGIVLALIACGLLPAADDAPSWLRDLAAAKVPQYSAKIPAVTLLDEESIVFEEKRMILSSRYALRILTVEGRKHAEGHRVYRTDSGKVKDIRGWIIYPTGTVRKLGKDEIVDVALADNDVYNETRVRKVSAVHLVDPGAVFGFESVVEDSSIFAQMEWQFQAHLPVLTSRVSATLPPGWEYRSFVFNHSEIKPVSSGSTHTWQINDLPSAEDEEGAPSMESVAPRIALSFFPPPGSRSDGWKSFTEWSGVADWLSELNDGRSEPDPAVTAKAKDLADGAGTLLEKVKRIGAFAQRVQYIAIQTGIGRGGGYRAHPAAEVFAKGYGDCKDKATLMQAMLKVVGVTSYPVYVFSGDPTYVRAEWPSPQQFNHAIIAIPASADWNDPAIAEYPKLGRILFFDPTDEITPLGQLPHYEQTSLALVGMPKGGELIRLPESTPKQNLVERSTETVLEPDGSVSVKMIEKRHGHNAVALRRAALAQSQPDFRKSIEHWIGTNVSGAVVGRADREDDGSETVSLALEFKAPAYAKSMQGRLLVLRPAILGRPEPLTLKETSRRLPIHLGPELFVETVRVKMPAGFRVDEMPDPISLEAPFGRYEAKYEMDADTVVLHRKSEVRSADLPPAAYKEVRDFFLKARGFDQTPVVLAR